MKEWLWRRVAWLASRKPVANWLIKRAQRCPYFHLEGYMNRWWLFNRYSVPGEQTKIIPRWPWLPSIRIHHILREDYAEHLHDHPWEGRTIILRGWYVERREDGERYVMSKGDTRAIKYGEYHSIDSVSIDYGTYPRMESSVYTMFITWKYQGTWGFLVDGKKVHWKQYVSEHPERS